jgi:CBS domain-containing protein
MEQKNPAESKVEKKDSEKEKAKNIALLEIPAQRQDFVHIYYQATLEEALKRLNKDAKDALLVERDSGGLKRTLGVVTQNDINRYYQYSGN